MEIHTIISTLFVILLGILLIVMLIYFTKAANRFEDVLNQYMKQEEEPTEVQKK